MKILVRLILIICLSQVFSLAQTPTTIISHPAGATLSINGKKIGITPLNSYSIRTGEHEFELELEGYAPVKRRLTVQPAKSLELEFHLNELHEVSFISEVPGLRFQIGHQSWEGKKTILTMETGIHNIEIFAGETLIDSLQLNVLSTMKFIYGD